MKLAWIFGGVAVIGLIVWGVLTQRPEQKLSSVVRTGEYFSTSTVNAQVAGIYYVTPTSSTSTPSLSRTLGSVVITSSTSAVGFTILDANGFVTDTIAVFNSNPVVGTYVFDRFIRYGLVIVVPSAFNGHIVTTYR